MACSNLLVLGIALCKIVSAIPVIDDKSITSGADLIKGLGHLSSQDQSDGNSVKQRPWWGGMPLPVVPDVLC